MQKRVKTTIFQGFGAVGAQNFSPAALKRSNFGLNLMYLRMSILRQIGVLKNGPPFISDLRKGGAFLRTWRKISVRRPEILRYFASLPVQKRVKTNILQGFGAVGAQKFSPAALKRSKFGLNRMY